MTGFLFYIKPNPYCFIFLTDKTKIYYKKLRINSKLGHFLMLQIQQNTRT
jgi:hypothetical protein